ncbi:hypothetical protein R75461_08332 [Paraburkholderia nemoris]|nr:hypothetical protein R75461_08332 [Paraburkholderia nemoris]
MSRNALSEGNIAMMQAKIRFSRSSDTAAGVGPSFGQEHSQEHPMASYQELLSQREALIRQIDAARQAELGKR